MDYMGQITKGERRVGGLSMDVILLMRWNEEVYLLESRYAPAL